MISLQLQPEGTVETADAELSKAGVVARLHEREDRCSIFLSDPDDFQIELYWSRSRSAFAA